jgi:catechol 2,3-dioxygenase-like lactoylglutathione lyase family enzyme
MDHATPNLPSRSFDQTEQFYARLGFERDWRDEGWLILARGSLTLEFFPHPDLDPATSWFSCCLRMNDIDAFCDAALAAQVPEADVGWPRIHLPRLEPSGERIGYLVDPDGTLLRLVANPPAI